MFEKCAKSVLVYYRVAAKHSKSKTHDKSTHFLDHLAFIPVSWLRILVICSLSDSFMFTGLPGVNFCLIEGFGILNAPWN